MRINGTAMNRTAMNRTAMNRTAMNRTAMNRTAINRTAINRTAINRTRDRDSGSAILEFLMLALPLFLPLILFLTNVTHKSQMEFDANNLARQLIRAYETSPELALAPLRLSKVEQAFEEHILLPHGIAVPASYSLNCSSDPCLTPGSRIELTVTLTSAKSSESTRAKVIEYVDQWKSS